MARVAVEATPIWPQGAGEEEPAVLANWFVHEGAAVREGQVLAELAIEKVAVEVPAPATGTLAKIEVPEDQELHMGDTLAWIETG